MNVQELEKYVEDNAIKIGRADKTKLAAAITILESTKEYFVVDEPTLRAAGLGYLCWNGDAGERRKYYNEEVVQHIYKGGSTPIGTLKKLGYKMKYKNDFNGCVKAINKSTKKKKKEVVEKKRKGVYGIYIEGKLVYIGKTSRDFRERWMEHVNYAKNPQLESSQQNYLYAAMRKGKDVKMEILAEVDNFSNAEIECVECALIHSYKPQYNYQGVKVPYVFSESKRRTVKWKENI